MGLELSYNLAAWAGCNATRQAQLEDWQTLALEQITAGNGREVVSTNANGVSITFASGSTNEDWFNTLTRALSIIANGFPVKRKQAIFGE